MENMGNMENIEKNGVNLKDLISIDNIPKELLDSMNDLNLDSNSVVEKELTEEERKKNIELLKKKLQVKQSETRNKRRNKISKEDDKMKMLKENPLFKSLGSNLDGIDIKSVINNMASKMCTDSKQKKMVKKQMEKLVEQIKNQESK